MDNLTDDEKKRINRVAEALSRASENEWVDILHKEFGVPQSMIETLCEAYHALGGESLLEVVSRAKQETSDGLYNTYVEGQVLKPSDDDVALAEQAMKKAGLYDEKATLQADDLQADDLQAIDE